MKYLQATDIKSYKEDIEDARNQSEIDQILRMHRKKTVYQMRKVLKKLVKKQALQMNLHSQLLQSSTNEENKLDELDKVIADLDSLSEKVDTHQQNGDMKSEQDSTNNNENSQISSGQSASSQNNKNQINDKNDDTSILDEMDNVKMT